MAVTLTALLKKQIFCASRIDRFMINTAKAGKANLDLDAVLKRQQLLKEYWEDFTVGHLTLLIQPDAEATEYVKSDQYSAVESQYLNHSAALSEMRARLTPTTSSGGTTTGRPTPLPPPEMEPALPPIHLPVFSGDLLQWESFRDQFGSLVHHSARLSKVRKLQYLKASLSGEAAQMLARTPITESHYDGAWAALEKRFGNKRILSATHMRRVIRCPSATKGSPSEYKRLLAEFRQTVDAFTALGKPVVEWDEWFSFLILEKLDPTTRLSWETSRADPTEVPTFAAVELFLETRLHALSASHSSEPPPLVKSRDQGGRPPSAAPHIRTTLPVTTSSPPRKSKLGPRCPKCESSHSLGACPKFKKLGPRERRSFATRVQACLSCLYTSHPTASCPSIHRCFVCDAKHHTLLHDAFRDQGCPAEDTEQNSPSISPVSTASYTISSNRVVLLGTARVRLQSSGGRHVFVRALLDSGSESSFVSEWVVRKLALQRRPVNVKLTGYQGRDVGSARHEVSLELASELRSQFTLTFDALVSKFVTSPTPSKRVTFGNWSHIRGLPLADRDFQVPSQVDLLLGADVCGQLFQETRSGPPGTPSAIRTPLGWVLIGAASADPPVLSTSRTRVLHTQCEEPLRFDLRRFWELDQVPTTSPLSPEDHECEQFFSETHSRDPTGRYTVRLPFRAGQKERLGDSRNSALRILLSNERRRARDPLLKQKYGEFMDEYLRLCHMEKAPTSLSDRPGGFYLPHHAVWKVTDTGSKIRVVFNGSAPSGSGLSLNDALLPGPKLQSDLWLVLTRWRLFRFAFSADIVKMFRQIRIHPDDRDWLRILWRSDPASEVNEYRLSTVTYGTSPAPYLALRVLQQLAQDEQHRFPRGAQAIYHHSYVDDILAGADTIAEAVDTRNQVLSMLRAGGFELDKWASNCTSILTDPASDIKFFQDAAKHGALGMVWQTEHDTLSVKGVPSLEHPEPHWTKRNVLSDVCRLFDPMGWLSPVLIRSKILIQDLWLSGVGWDDPLPSALSEPWTTFRHSLGELASISIPRWVAYAPSERSALQLHGFCDASARAYSASVYLRALHPDGSTSLSLLVAKTRVAPTKTVSIPRLELCGAVLLARLLSALKIGLNLADTRTLAWSDSSVTIAWIRSHASRWTPFVAHRVAEVQTLLPEVQWRHLRTDHNPADLATRGITPTDLRSSRLWWQGPDWLHKPEASWPRSPVELDVDNLPESRPAVSVLLTQPVPSFGLLERFSSFNRLTRVTAFMLRFARNAKTPAQRIVGALSSRELSTARACVCKLSQQETFAAEYTALARGQQIKPSSLLAKLNPFLDQHGLIRVGGRLEQAQLTADQRHPVIISRYSPLATLMVRWAHSQTLHGGFSLTRCYLLQQYWIPRHRTLVKKVLAECVRCLRFRGQTGQQQMGSLPAHRLQVQRPFCHSGVDYAGPIMLRNSKGRGCKAQKGYICIFVCLSTKAVHIEVVSDLTSDAFLAAFNRFVSRRGRCSHIWSDNATTFKGADLQLQNLFRAASDFYKEVSEVLATDGTQWSYIPPYSPHFGGIWEAAVKSVKTHLRRVIGDHTLTFEELTTLLCRIESCLNSRPLCPQSDDPLDLSALTPGHFLIGEPMSSPPEPGVPPDSTTPAKRWKLLIQMRDHFWSRWSREYLHQLQQLPKWRRQKPNLVVGTLVLIKDELLPPMKWPLARIVETHPGPDGLVRVVTARSAIRTFRRSVARIVPLHIDTSPADLHGAAQSATTSATP